MGDPWVIKAYADGKAIVEHGGKTYWVKPPFTEDTIEEAPASAPMIAVTRHDWEALVIRCESFADVVAYVENKALAELEDHPVPSPGETARRLLRLASPTNNVLDHFLGLLEVEERPANITRVAEAIRTECPWIVQHEPYLRRLEACEARAGVMTYEQWLATRVRSHPDILAGEPTFVGTRLSVRKIGMMLLKQGECVVPELHVDYPYLTDDDLYHAPRFAREQ